MNGFGYNAAIVKHGGETLMFYRFHKNHDWKTTLAVACMDGGFNALSKSEIGMPKEAAGYSHEDLRAFHLDGNLHASYTCSDAINGQFRSIQAFGPLENVDGQWRITKHIVPKYAGNDFSGMVKNFVPIIHNGNLHFIFGNLRASMEQLVLQMDGDKVVKEHRSPAPTWAYGGIRGGCVIPFKGQLLRFFHSRTGDTKRSLGFRYHLGAALAEPEPPFKSLMVSSFPILSGNEKYTHCPTWKPNCVLPYGVMADGDRFKVSVGLNDCECGILDLSVGDLNL